MKWWLIQDLFKALLCGIFRRDVSSEAASCVVIGMASYLTSKDLRQMREYLDSVDYYERGGRQRAESRSGHNDRP